MLWCFTAMLTLSFWYNYTHSNTQFGQLGTICNDYSEWYIYSVRALRLFHPGEDLGRWLREYGNSVYQSQGRSVVGLMLRPSSTFIFQTFSRVMFFHGFILSLVFWSWGPGLSASATLRPWFWTKLGIWQLGNVEFRGETNVSKMYEDHKLPSAVTLAR